MSKLHGGRLGFQPQLAQPLPTAPEVLQSNAIDDDSAGGPEPLGRCPEDVCQPPAAAADEDRIGVRQPRQSLRRLRADRMDQARTKLSDVDFEPGEGSGIAFDRVDSQARGETSGFKRNGTAA